MNIYEYAIAQAERAGMSDDEARDAIAKALAEEPPRKKKREGVSLAYNVTPASGRLSYNGFGSGLTKHG